jgi:hypothetical protein
VIVLILFGLVNLSGFTLPTVNRVQAPGPPVLATLTMIRRPPSG